MAHSHEQRLRQKNLYLPKDFVETQNGLLFAVVTEGIEDGRLLAQLRYKRTPRGPRKLSTEEASRHLQDVHPDWFFHSLSRDVKVHGVPLEYIGHHFQPRRFFDQVDFSTNQADTNSAETIYKYLVEDGLKAEVGVTGSHLIGASTANSDIDLVIYGLADFHRCRQRVSDLVRAGFAQWLSDEMWKTSFERRGCELSLDEYLWHERRKCNKFSWKGTKVDMGCVTNVDPRAAAAGKKAGAVRFQARVVDDHAAFSSPSVFGVDHPKISAVVSHTPTYTGQAKCGEQVDVSGWLEVCGQFNRVVVGTSREARNEFIRVLR